MMRHDRNEPTNERMADLRAEFRKHAESWDRQRTRLTAEVERLRAEIRDRESERADLRETVARVETLCAEWEDAPNPSIVLRGLTQLLRQAIDGEG